MPTEQSANLSKRATVFAALADPARLTIVDRLLLADASPSELRMHLSISSNLLAHHLGVLKKAGIVRQTRSEADGRRTYLTLNYPVLESLIATTTLRARRVVFVCTQNSARSQLAAAIWTRRSAIPATSAGTQPAPQAHPGAVAAARRNKLPMRPQTPRYLGDVLTPDDLVIAVCDNAHEALPAEVLRIHWSVGDPARTGLPEAFDEALRDLTERIDRFAPHLQSA